MIHGNGWVLKTALGGGITVWIAITSFMGTSVVRNRELNIADHTVIRSEMVNRDEKIGDKIENVKDIVTDIRVEQREQMMILKELAK